MYEDFFNLQRTPFSRDLPTTQLWINETRREMHSRLLYVANNKSFGLFTGDAGTGKTTAIRKFASDIDISRFQIIYIADSALTPRNFYYAALHQLGQIPRFYRGDAQRQLHQTLSAIIESDKKTPVFIIDEAHLLSREMLEEIRFLLNTKMDSVSTLALILVGQSELKDMLKLHVNSAILQRLDIRYHLSPLDMTETAAYVKSHMAAAGSVNDIFTDTALDLIHAFCEGLPRMINKVAVSCLLTAATRKSALIDDHLVHLVIEREFMV